MLVTAVIPVLREEPGLIETLTALVSGVAEGLVRDVVIASPPGLAFASCIAEASGAEHVQRAGRWDVIAGAGLEAGRADQVLLISPGIVPTGDWMQTVAIFIAALPPSDLDPMLGVAIPPGFKSRALLVAARILGPDARFMLVGPKALIAASLMRAKRPPIKRLPITLADRRTLEMT